MRLISKLAKALASRILKRFGLRVTRPGPYGIFDFESFLYRHIEVHKTLSFIQIGANDGVMNDPIFKFNMKNKDVVSGYVLEPLPDVYSSLVNNYKSSPNIYPLNLAIHNSKTEMLLYRVKPEFLSKVPNFARGIASFDPEHWKKTALVPNSDYIQSETVRCISYSTLLQTYQIEAIDLLLLDTEGYDYEILMGIDFYHSKPKIIRFEHGVRNGVMSHSQLLTVCSRLNSFGYQIIAESYDATAYVLDPGDLVF